MLLEHHPDLQPTEPACRIQTVIVQEFGRGRFRMTSSAGIQHFPQSSVDVAYGPALARSQHRKVPAAPCAEQVQGYPPARSPQPDGGDPGQSRAVHRCSHQCAATSLPWRKGQRGRADRQLNQCWRYPPSQSRRPLIRRHRGRRGYGLLTPAGPCGRRLPTVLCKWPVFPTPAGSSPSDGSRQPDQRLKSKAVAGWRLHPPEANRGLPSHRAPPLGQ